MVSILRYLGQKQVQEVQLVSLQWYYVYTPMVYESSKIRFSMEDIYERAVFVQYYEGCLMWIDIASYIEDQTAKRNGRVPADGDLYSQEHFHW